MRVVTFVFALMLVMGLSFGGSTLVSTQSAIAEHHEDAADPAGEIPGGEMKDDAEGNMKGAADDAGDAKDAMGEIPGGEMADDAAGNMKGAADDAIDGAADSAADKAKDAMGEMPGGEMKDDAAK